MIPLVSVLGPAVPDLGWLVVAGISFGAAGVAAVALALSFKRETLK